MAVSATEDDKSWYSRSLSQIFDSLEADSDGLSTAEARDRRSEYGPNRLPRAKPVTVGQIFLRQFKNPLIYILGIAALVSFGIGEETDAAFILIVLLVNASVGGIQEWQAERSSQALQQLIQTRATVVRDGGTSDVDGEEIVPGDVILLESGDSVPADMRLLSTHGLKIDESALTEESEPVSKDEDWKADDRAPLGDRRNMAHAGTMVTRGRGRGITVETSSNTVVGRLAENVTAIEGGQPPLVTRMQRFTRIVGLVVVVAAAFTALLGIVVQQYDTIEMFLFATALAVSAIPEGLPVGITVALGVASRRMASVGVIVRRLVAVEGLGSCTMIASDKTGTLTVNELTAKRVQLPNNATFEVTGEGYPPDGKVMKDGHPPTAESSKSLARLAQASVLCNEGHLSRHEDQWRWRGDPTDIALLALGRKLGWSRESALDKQPQIDAIPFEPEQRYAATYHQADDTTRVFVKGAPERVLSICVDASRGDFSEQASQQRATELAHSGYRVLAVAEGTVESIPTSNRPPVEPTELTFLGFIGLIDPLRAGVAEAISSAREAGISVTMITGDHPETALSIAQNIGLAESMNEVTTGNDLVGISQDQLRKVVDTTWVFARVSPDQKLKIVTAARTIGHYVAVTGDGVNDAPALRQANIGVAMGKMGTDAARDAAELVISDDNFSTIVAGIEQGRVAFDNIRKVIYLLISTGAGEVALILLSLGAGLPLALLPVQILWLNLVTNGIQDVALAFEPKEQNILNRPPRPPDERIFNQIMIERTLVAALVISVIGFGAFSWLLAQGLSEAAARNHLLLFLVMFEIVNIGNARSETISIFQLSPLQSPILLTGTIAAFLVHLGAMYFPPAQAILGTAPVGLHEWLALGAIAISVAIAIELHKLSWKLRHPQPPETEYQPPS